MGDGSVPLAIIDAHKRGTGKTLLADLVAEVATGRPGSMMTAPADDAEWRKQITTQILEGRSFITVDNVVEPLRDASLSSVLTCRRWTARILGKSQSVDLPHRATWVANGNNVQVAGDMPRRCYWIHLESTQATPWKRTGFAIPNLRAWVVENRGRLVAALLTLARAWVVRGKKVPPDLPVLGGFDQWTQTVGGILYAAGVPKFLANLDTDQARQSIEDKEWTAFLETWYGAFENDWVTVSELLPQIGVLPTGDQERNLELAAAVLPSALAAHYSDKPGSFNHQLGRELKAHEKERFGECGFYVEGKDGTTRGGRLWCVRRQCDDDKQAGTDLTHAQTQT